MHRYSAPEKGPTSKSTLSAVVPIAATVVAAVFAASLLLQQSAGAQGAATGQLVVQDVGVSGYEFTATIHAEGATEAAAGITFDDQASSPLVLDAANYTVRPMAVEGFGYRGWAMGEAGICPPEPASTEAEIPLAMSTGANVLLCIYHEEGAVDIASLEVEESEEGLQVTDTPAAPSTGSGLAQGSHENPKSLLLLAAGGVLLIAGGVTYLSLRRRLSC